MKLIEVNTPKLAKEFLRANVEINKDNHNYIQPLDKDINELFDPKEK